MRWGLRVEEGMLVYMHGLSLAHWVKERTLERPSSSNGLVNGTKINERVLLFHLEYRYSRTRLNTSLSAELISNNSSIYERVTSPAHIPPNLKCSRLHSTIQHSTSDSSAHHQRTPNINSTKTNAPQPKPSPKNPQKRDN